MRLLKRQNDIMTEGIMTKETGSIMCLLKRHNKKRTESRMTKETREAMAKDRRVREYLISFSLSNSLQRYSRNELFMYLCRRCSMLEWWCNLLMNNHNNTGYLLIYRLLSNNYSCVFYLLHWDRITFKNKSNYDKKPFTIYMAWLSFSLAFNMPHFPYTWIWFIRSNQYLLRTDNRGKSFLFL